jgi:hypothetical protein
MTVLQVTEAWAQAEAELIRCNSQLDAVLRAWPR